MGKFRAVSSGTWSTHQRVQATTWWSLPKAASVTLMLGWRATMRGKGTLRFYGVGARRGFPH